MRGHVTALRPNCSVGERVRLGGLLGYGNEPGDLMGRIVGIRKSEDVRPIERFIIRLFTEDDFRHGRLFPTGECRTSWLVVPWTGYYPHPVAT